MDILLRRALGAIGRATSRLVLIVAFAVTITSWHLVFPAFAGLVVSDEVSPEALTPLHAAEAYYTYLEKSAPGAVEPLLDYAAVRMDAPKCVQGAKPTVHAILIGASTAGAPFNDLAGPDNDVALLAASLKSRGVEDRNLAVLSGSNAGRAKLTEVLLNTLRRVKCGDQVVLHFGGNSARAQDLITAVIPEELRNRFSSISIVDIWNADFINSEHKPTLAMRWAERAGLFLALNKQTDGVLELISAADVSDFVTNIRNLQADITVTLDTSYAAAADLAGRQEKAGDTLVWSLETSGEGVVEKPYEYAPVTVLLPNRGRYAAFYSSVGDSEAVELGFDGPGGAKTTYGVFTFRLANVIQNRDSVTVRALAESLKTLPTGDAAAVQRYRIEASDPELVLFSDGSKQLPPTDPIVITKPAPKRGAAAMERPEVEIAGTVNWSAPLVAVLVDGNKAESRPDGGFDYAVTLKVGLNNLDIVALTADGRTHEKTLEFVFKGDKKALEGEGMRYAVIVANETYERSRTGFDALKTPFEDADAIAKVLTGKYGFVTEAKMPDGKPFQLLLKDASRLDIETLLYKIGLAAGEKDTVLIYFAGHGIYEEKTTIAFWVPTDAEAGVPISYLSASTISEAVQRMQAGKVVIISDSCFSGALLRGGGEAAPKIGADERERALLRLSQRRTRILISSGNNEPVEDLGGAGHSVFARALLTGLEDMQHDAFSARELYDGYILPLVIANADQEPQYRPIDRSGHEGGDIVFIRQTQ